MLSSELYLIVCSWLSRSTLRSVKRTSKRMRAIVDSCLLSKVADKPLFANMDKSDCLRYLEQSRIVSDEGKMIFDPEVAPWQLYYTEESEKLAHCVSFIDIDYQVYIDGALVPNIQGQSLSRTLHLFSSGSYSYFIQGRDGLFYIYYQKRLIGKPLSLHRISETYALDHDGKVLRFDDEDPNFPLHELRSKAVLPSFVDLMTVEFLCHGPGLRFLICLKDEQGCYWLMLEDDYRVWTLSQIIREKKILQIEPCDEMDEGKCFFHVLFEDGSVEPMMVVIDEDDSLTMFFRDIEHHGLVFSELRGDFLYDAQGKEYCINEDEVEVTGFTKWHSRRDWCMIAY